LVIALGLLGGCAKKTTYGAVKFDSKPPGAEILNLRDDTNLGMTPAMVTFEGKGEEPEHVTVEMRKPGFKEKITTFWVNKRHGSRAAAENNPQEITVELIKKD
jgi:hypothetical protein